MRHTLISTDYIQNAANSGSPFLVSRVFCLFFKPFGIVFLKKINFFSFKLLFLYFWIVLIYYVKNNFLIYFSVKITLKNNIYNSQTRLTIFSCILYFEIIKIYFKIIKKINLFYLFISSTTHVQSFIYLFLVFRNTN
jgi:hypothetical protein